MAPRKFPPHCGITCRLALALAERFAQAQGNAVSLTPREVADKADIPPVVAGELLRALAQKGYAECQQIGKKLRCTVLRSSPLWSADPAKIAELLERL
ncbi:MULTISPECIES: hypothetical protein [Pyrobaculum]|uniref:Helix-turn-helix domain-containing protein n=1 Tax=Pyrobaculum arsenaticum TaxID=121277 RepID=A0A7L4P679_9CREN|nr:hypothetical protein [Pyrobaculum arsenaticum]MCY0890460.1 hypothetical protein [Pyrobaculum arsenaticum]NYR14591.1 hypothetical protein [Pyrobaculum arsenaticum]